MRGARRESISDIQRPVSRIMSSPVISISGSASVAEAAAKMMMKDVGFMPVLEGKHVIGTVTDRDLAIDVLSKEMDYARRSVREVMRPGVQTCWAHDTIKVAAGLMGDYQVRRLPVLATDGTLVGVVSVADIAVEISEKLAGEALGEIAEER